MIFIRSACLCVLGGILPLLPASGRRMIAARQSETTVEDGLRISANHRYLVDAAAGSPVFLLADTAWNLNALRLDEIDTYLRSRADHGFNAVMFALNFFPQAAEDNAYGQPAYIGREKTRLNPAYFRTCDAIVGRAAARGLYVILFAMWAGEKAGTMNRYSEADLRRIGLARGRRPGAPPTFFWWAGGAAPPPYVDVARVDALGSGLKEGCAGRNLVTVHPVSGTSASKCYATSRWLDFYFIQGKSGTAPGNAAFDAAALVRKDWSVIPAKPTMMAENTYESGTGEDPLVQRRSLYQCVFAGGFGYAYGHDALWQMTPHTAQPWMLRGWNPGVESWKQALDTPAVGQLRHIKRLLYSHPYLSRIPDQSLVLAGQGPDVATRVQATRDGTFGHRDATYIMAYLSAARTVTLDTAVIAARTLNAYGFDPATGSSETIRDGFANTGSLTLPSRARGGDWVAVIEDAARNYPRPDGAD